MAIRYAPNGALVDNHSGVPIQVDDVNYAHNGVLYSWGFLNFTVQPFNIHEVDHATATDWAQKHIVGAAIYREWVGENDEEIFVRGRLFPHKFGGMGPLNQLETSRRQGIASVLSRGGEYLGWFVCERLIRGHKYLAIDGIGQMIEFEAVFVRVPIPPSEMYFPVLFGSGMLG